MKRKFKIWLLKVLNSDAAAILIIPFFLILLLGLALGFFVLKIYIIKWIWGA